MSGHVQCLYGSRQGLFVTRGACISRQYTDVYTMIGHVYVSRQIYVTKQCLDISL